MSAPSPSTLREPLNRTMLFDDFFSKGAQANDSPFLTPSARTWGRNLSLKASIVASMLLFLAFICSSREGLEPFSYLALFFVYFLSGATALIDALEDLFNLEINIDVLMIVASFSSIFIGSGMEGGLLLVLFSLSGAMEDAVTAKAKGAISSLHKLSPSKACVIDQNGLLMERAVQDVSVGSAILIKAGEVVPLDGVVISGSSSVNLVHLSGETTPVAVKVGDQLPAGGYNLDGVLTMRVSRTSGDSTLAKIIELVTQAQDARPALQRWFDKLSQNYATAIIVIALLAAMTLPTLSGIPYLGVEGSIYRALAFLIAASPCALIIAIPIAYLSAIGACARTGILLKGGITLDALAGCSIIAFDKTGTLTLGELSCQGVRQLSVAPHASSEELERSKSKAVAIAYALERNAVHPIGKAISAYFLRGESHTPPVSLIEFSATPGYGLEALALLPEGAVPCAIGSQEFIEGKLSEKGLGAAAQELESAADELHRQGHPFAVLLMGEDLFIFYFRDLLRPKIKETIKAIVGRGLRVMMLTGDHRGSAAAIAAELGVSEYYADLKPEDKLSHISQLAQKEKLAMVGDGINDAPALARATVGICMGKVGSATSIEVADIVLLQDDIELLDWLLRKAYQTQAVVRQNLWMASSVILLASLPALFGEVPLWLAVVFHEGGTVVVGLNGLRLLRKRLSR